MEKGIVPLLLVDHRAMKKFMKVIKSHRASYQKKLSTFQKLSDLIKSHVKSEEHALLNPIMELKPFHDHALESKEEHKVHLWHLAYIASLSDKERKDTHMKIFCEFLEEHLEEEETELFPRYKKHFALTTRKKAGKKFVRERKVTSKGLSKQGLLRGRIGKSLGRVNKSS